MTAFPANSKKAFEGSILMDAVTAELWLDRMLVLSLIGEVVLVVGLVIEKDRFNRRNIRARLIGEWLVIAGVALTLITGTLIHFRFAPIMKAAREMQIQELKTASAEANARAAEAYASAAKADARAADAQLELERIRAPRRLGGMQRGRLAEGAKEFAGQVVMVVAEPQTMESMDFAGDLQAILQMVGLVPDEYCRIQLDARGQPVPGSRRKDFRTIVGPGVGVGPGVTVRHVANSERGRRLAELITSCVRESDIPALVQDSLHGPHPWPKRAEEYDKTLCDSWVQIIVGDKIVPKERLRAMTRPVDSSKDVR